MTSTTSRAQAHTSRQRVAEIQPKRVRRFTGSATFGAGIVNDGMITTATCQLVPSPVKNRKSRPATPPHKSIAASKDIRNTGIPCLRNYLTRASDPA